MAKMFVLILWRSQSRLITQKLELEKEMEKMCEFENLFQDKVYK